MKQINEHDVARSCAIMIKDRQDQLEKVLGGFLQSLFDCLADQYEVSRILYRRCKVKVVYRRHIIAEIHLRTQAVPTLGWVPEGEKFFLVNLMEMVEAVFGFGKVRVYVNGKRQYTDWHTPHILVSYNLVPFNSIQ